MTETMNRMKARAMSEVRTTPLTLVLMKMDDINFCMIEVFRHEVQNVDAAGVLFYKCIKTDIGKSHNKQTINMSMLEIEENVSILDFSIVYMDKDDSIPCFFKKYWMY